MSLTNISYFPRLFDTSWIRKSPCYDFPSLNCKCSIVSRVSHGIVFSAGGGGSKKPHNKKQELSKNLRYPRQTKVPPDLYPVLHRGEELNQIESEASAYNSDENDSVSDNGDVVWGTDEIEAISSLFQGRVPQKPGKIARQRPLPLPLPHKIRPSGLPTHKNLNRTHHAVSSRQSITNQVYKNPTFLVGLAREIRDLPPEENVSKVLNRWSQFLRKGSLSLTVRELGHMGFPDRALHVFNWAETQTHLFPDDRILASTVEVLARAHELKVPYDLDKFISLASKSVCEAMVRGFIKGGNSRLAWKLLVSATNAKRMLDPSVYVKLILLLGKNPDKRMLVFPLLDELAKRDDFKLTQQDCTAMIKVCVKLGKFEVVEALYNWFKTSCSGPNVVMYTTLIHSRHMENKHRDAMALVWEMEASNVPLDLPAYRVLIKLFVALNDLPRTTRYFAKLKECGFSPTYDIYREVTRMYLASGRLAKCREISREAEMAGFKLDEHTMLN